MFIIGRGRRSLFPYILSMTLINKVNIESYFIAHIHSLREGNALSGVCLSLILSVHRGGTPCDWSQG